jgi:hypothetical protein
MWTLPIERHPRYAGSASTPDCARLSIRDRFGTVTNRLADRGLNYNVDIDQVIARATLAPVQDASTVLLYEYGVQYSEFRFGFIGLMSRYSKVEPDVLWVEPKT